MRVLVPGVVCLLLGAVSFACSGSDGPAGMGPDAGSGGRSSGGDGNETGDGGGSDGRANGTGGDTNSMVPDDGDCQVVGTRQLWHKLSIVCEGPDVGEDSSPNPFTDYAMTVTFENGSSSMKVLGHFAADGDAANTGAKSGNKWRAHFMPVETGVWNYSVSFATGSNVAVDGGGTPVADIDGASGGFLVEASDKSGRDFRARGLLEHKKGERYLRFRGDESVFISAGPDVPENFLEYYEFDNTVACPGNNAGVVHEFSAQGSSWQSGDPSWGSDKGKNIIGTVNYVASTGSNVMYMIPMNITGDGNRTYPYTSCGERLRFDVSKLEQWGIVFDHMTEKGVLLHLIEQEAENDQMLGAVVDGELTTERKVYLRELISRFAHSPAIQWNMGEEPGYNSALDVELFKAIASYHKANDPYRHQVMLHSPGGKYDETYSPFLGFEDFDGTTFQGWYTIHDATVEWIDKSTANGHPWVVTATEMSGNAAPTPDNPVPANMRQQWMWGNIMGGGGGVEFYLLKAGASHGFDQAIEDLTVFDALWKQCGHVTQFFRMIQKNYAFDLNRLVSSDGSASGDTDWVLANDSADQYILYADGGNGALGVQGAASGSYDLYWLDTVTGNTKAESVTVSGNASFSRPSGIGVEAAVFAMRSSVQP